MPNANPGSSISLTIRFQYNGGNGNNADPTLTANPISKLCIAYRIPSEPNTTKYCNIVGPTTNNPTSCN